MDRVIKADLFRYGRASSFVEFIRTLGDPGFRYVYLLRKASHHRSSRVVRVFFEILKRRYGYKYGFQIPTSTNIGAGFFIGHFGTIVISCRAKIGKNCNVAHGVTIGKENRGRREGYPTIGDKVWIGTGAVIVGNVKIGSDVLIAPNSFVNFDVPSNSLVIGNPARIIDQENPTRDYIENILY